MKAEDEMFADNLTPIDPETLSRGIAKRSM
jgi:hypothetical protein